MVDGNIHKNIAVMEMDRIGQFHELLQGGGRRIEFGQGRVHFCKIQGRIGAAESSHAGIGGGGGMDGQKVQDPAPQAGKNKFHLPL